MLRQLLTLLAVISGFTLAAEPVSAADARAVSVAAEALGEDGLTAALEAQSRAIVSPAIGQVAQAAVPAIAITPQPTVYLQSDRARE